MRSWIKSFSNSIPAVLALFATAGLAKADQPPMESALIQALIDMAQPGQIVVPPPGRYKKIKITRPIVLDGKGMVTFDGGGEGSVVWVETNNATVRGIKVVNSGIGHPQQDAAFQVRGSDNLIEDNVLEDVLFGIVLERSDRNLVRRNRYVGKPFSMQRRGDGVKLWYSNDNTITENEFVGGRDVVFWYANGNKYTNNRQKGGRYGLHLMKASDNLAEGNLFLDNMTGISMMYDSGDVIRNNYVAKANGAVGTCMSLKESSDIVVERNDLMYCASGIAIDVSPYEPGTQNFVRDNRIAYNDIGISFLNDWKGTTFTGNLFTGNITEVAIYGGGSAVRNQWDGNRWEDYQGFDTNGDGVGDKPHRLFGYAGRVWMDVPNTKFFKGTPLLEVLDFLDRLAPFSQPTLILEDKHPRLGGDRGFKAGSSLEPKS